MKVIGLTGSMASGKSTVAQIFRKKGIPVIDADKSAREVLKPSHVLELFGPDYLDQAGLIDRKKLAAFVFSDKQARQKLEQLTHPLIAQRLQEKLSKLEEQGFELVIYEASLIFETGIQSRFDAVILVVAPEKMVLERARERDGLSSIEVKKRLAAQMSVSEKIKLADYVIENSSDLKSLETLVNNLELQSLQFRT